MLIGRRCRWVKRQLISACKEINDCRYSSMMKTIWLFSSTTTIATSVTKFWRNWKPSTTIRTSTVFSSWSPRTQSWQLKWVFSAFQHLSTTKLEYQLCMTVSLIWVEIFNSYYVKRFPIASDLGNSLVLLYQQKSIMKLLYYISVSQTMKELTTIENFLCLLLTLSGIFC